MDEDGIRILVASDNHLGYQESDPIRYNDSFEAFEEVLKIAREKEVDLLLLGGDFFDENKPSRDTINKAMILFRKYCCGDRPIKISVTSDTEGVIHGPFPHVNFEDPNYNIDLPVFLIHGNHDDPSKDALNDTISAVELLSTSNLINYFGRQEAVDHVEIKPICIEKGQNKVALYGLGYIRDERINEMFKEKKVTFFRPSEEIDKWFNIFVIHQNRETGRGKEKCISANDLPSFLDLIVWGHEHETKIDLEQVVDKNFHICQPGSTVSTSYDEKEGVEKKLYLFNIKGTEFQYESIELHSVRPLLIKEITLVDSGEIDHRNPDIENILIRYLQKQVEDMLKAYNCNNHSNNCNKLPLVRLTVNQNEFPSIRNIRFAQLFLKLVANPSSILKFKKKRINKVTTVIDNSNNSNQSTSESHSLETIINRMIQSDSIQLKVLRKEDINRAMKECTKSRSLEWKKFIADTVQTVQTKLNRRRKELMKDLTESNTERAINSLKTDDGIESEEVLSILHKVKDIINGEKAPILQPIQSMEIEEEEDNNNNNDEGSNEKKKRKTTTTTSSSRGKRGGRGGRGGKSKYVSLIEEDEDNDNNEIDDEISIADDDDDEEEVIIKKKTRGRGGRGGRGGKKKLL